MSPAHHVIGLFGGTRKLAALGKYPPSTVQSWKDAGVIPAKHQPTLLDLAREHQIPMSPADFFFSPDEHSVAAPAAGAAA